MQNSYRKTVQNINKLNNETYIYLDKMETDDKNINPTRFLADFINCQSTKEVIDKLLSSEIAKSGVEHSLYPISKFSQILLNCSK